MGIVAQEVVPSRRGYCPIDIKTLKYVLDASHRLDAPRGKSSPTDGDQAKATFILAEDFDGTDGIGRDDRAQLLYKGGTKLCCGLRLF